MKVLCKSFHFWLLRRNCSRDSSICCGFVFVMSTCAEGLSSSKKTMSITRPIACVVLLFVLFYQENINAICFVTNTHTCARSSKKMKLFRRTCWLDVMSLFSVYTLYKCCCARADTLAGSYALYCTCVIVWYRFHRSHLISPYVCLIELSTHTNWHNDRNNLALHKGELTARPRLAGPACWAGWPSFPARPCKRGRDDQAGPAGMARTN